MKATDLLEEQHRIVRSLFGRLEDTEERAEQREVFEEIASNLVAHDAIEREIFYPACEQALGMTDQLGEALVEHGVVEFCLFEADQAPDEQFEFKCTVLKEMLNHHIDEEEDEFFPQVEKALGDEELVSLGEEMQTRFAEVMQSDFRGPLHDNLRQVLSGAMKTKKDGAPSQRQRPTASNKRTARAGARSASRQGTRNGSRAKGKPATQRSGQQRTGGRRHA